MKSWGHTLRTGKLFFSFFKRNSNFNNLKTIKTSHGQRKGQGQGQRQDKMEKKGDKRKTLSRYNHKRFECPGFLFHLMEMNESNLIHLVFFFKKIIKI
jgi:hypothetical protein